MDPLNLMIDLTEQMHECQHLHCTVYTVGTFAPSKSPGDRMRWCKECGAVGVSGQPWTHPDNFFGLSRSSAA